MFRLIIKKKTEVTSEKRLHQRRLPISIQVEQIEVVINHELEREFLGYANGLQVLYPQRLAEIMHKKLKRTAE